jgi:LemA protein
MGLDPTPRVLGPGEVLPESDATIETAVPSLLWPLVIIPVSAILAFLGLLIGFEKVKLKRLIENIPTTPATEVEIGITEIKGTVTSCDDIEPLTGPLTEKPCVWFRYHVQDWRGSGKRRHLVTIEDRTRGQVFLCSDASGSIPVASHDARVVTGRKSRRSRGIREYSEYSLRPEDPVYVLGSAEIDPATGDSLRIEKDPQGLPYLVSNLPERRLKTKEVVGAFWSFAFGIAATAAIILGLLLFTGRIAAVDQLLAALASIITIAFVVGVIMYNDLVFLRQRVAWARSNIDVALKKRIDLLPQLEAIAKGYMKYEHEVLPLLAKLRSAWSMKGEGVNAAGESVSASSAATSGLLALREQYPNLKADTTTEKLMRGIVALENEIAARRDGYNAAVERYRSRTHAIPEIALAKVFAFKEEPLLGWESEIRDLDPLDFERAERSDKDLGKEDAPE